MSSQNDEQSESSAHATVKRKGGGRAGQVQGGLTPLVDGPSTEGHGGAEHNIVHLLSLINRPDIQPRIFVFIETHYCK